MNYINSKKSTDITHLIPLRKFAENMHLVFAKEMTRHIKRICVIQPSLILTATNLISLSLSHRMKKSAKCNLMNALSLRFNR